MGGSRMIGVMTRALVAVDELPRDRAVLRVVSPR
jgi:hypothetical protein